MSALRQPSWGVQRHLLDEPELKLAARIVKGNQHD
jgi:hypothetical protein